MQILSLIVWETYINASGDNSSEYISDSDDVNIRPTKSQKTLVIDSDTKSESETQGAGEDIIDVSTVTTEGNNLQSVSEITKFLVSQNKNCWQKI